LDVEHHLTQYSFLTKSAAQILKAKNGMTKNLKMALTALALVAALSACGRKGDLEPPPGMSANEVSAQEQAAAKARQKNCVLLNEDGTTYSAPTPIDANNTGGAQSGNLNLMKTEEDDKPACP